MHYIGQKLVFILLLLSIEKCAGNSEILIAINCCYTLFDMDSMFKPFI